MAIIQTIDNSFGFKIPICQFCKNKDNDKCAVLGEIPKEIAEVKVLKCPAFKVDIKLYAQYEPFMPTDFDLDSVTE